MKQDCVHIVGGKPLSGAVKIPPSKSQTQRAILFASFAKGKSIIHSPLISEDTLHMIDVCQKLGASIQKDNDTFIIEGIPIESVSTKEILNVGESGIALRFLTGLVSLAKTPILLTGTGSILSRRNMEPLLNSLQDLGVRAESLHKDGFAPILIQGPFLGGKTTIDGSDSQYVSSLLITSLFSTRTVEINVQNPKETPWIEMTLDWLKRFSADISRREFSSFSIRGSGSISSFEYTVKGDMSSLAFLLGAALVTNSEITLENVDMDEPQGDKAIIPILQNLGANLEVDPLKKTLHVKKSHGIQGGSIDMDPLIDAFPILAALSPFAKGPLELKNVSNARIKESDRIASMEKELKKMGASISVSQESFLASPKKLKNGNLFAHHDHRIAMSMTVAALGTKGRSTLQGANSVSKTFPEFFTILKTLGADIT